MINFYLCIWKRLQEEHHEHRQKKREGKQKGKSDKRITESKARQKETLHCAQTSQIKPRKLLGNAENATRGGDKRRGSTGTLEAHGAGEERRGKRRHFIRGRRGLRTIYGGGQSAQDVVRVSIMDGERDLSALEGQQLAHNHPFRGGCLIGQLRQESRGVAAESTKFRE
jgi:hypothetical protein